MYVTVTVGVLDNWLYLHILTINVVEARCYVVDKDELISSMYVVESITT